MAINGIGITPEHIREAFIEQLASKHKLNPESIVNATEQDLCEFICKYVSPEFKGIYTETNHNFYDNVSRQIPLDPLMKAANDAADFKYSVHLKNYSLFLQSKQYKQLFKQRIAGSGEKPKPQGKDTTPHAPSKPKEREITEGEKVHVEFETAHRNPKLRQACIDKYGYQCQCCGMDFASLYGEELGKDFIEVHHLQMISTYDENRPEDYLDNLVPLCSNCHSMIHHGLNGPLTLRELREAYKGEKKPLTVCKED